MGNQVYKLFSDYGNCKISRNKFYEEATKVFNGDLYKFVHYYKKDIEIAEKTRSVCLSNKQLEVLYIHGPSGCGKTTIAKYMADKLGYSYFVSGSGDDFLDGYDKEECIILDDFRGSSLRFSELLKLLDNHTNSAIKSRYHNKDIGMAKLIVITSVCAPKDLYRSFNESDEPVEQLYRRLKHHYYDYKAEDDCYYDIQLPGSKKDLESAELVVNRKELFDELGIHVEDSDESELTCLFKRKQLMLKQ